MPIPIQNNKAARPLQEESGLRGKFALTMDEVVVPIADSQHAGGKPFFAPWRRGGDFIFASAAGAGEFSGVLIRPGVGMLLVIEDLYVMNGTGTAFSAWVNVMRPVDVANVAVTLGASSVMAEFTGRVNAGGFLPSLAAQSTIFSTTNVNIGARVLRARAALNSDTHYALPRGIILDGNDPAGLSAVAVIHETVNTAIDVGFYVVEHQDQR